MSSDRLLEIWKTKGLQLFALKPLNAGNEETDAEDTEDLETEEEDNLDLGQENEQKPQELSSEQIQEVLSMNETLQQQVSNLQQLVLNLSQGQQGQPQTPQQPEKPKKSFQMPSLDMSALGDLSEDEQALARVMAKILPGFLKPSLEPVIEQVSTLEEKHGRLETTNKQSKINAEVTRVFNTYQDAFTLQNKMVALANDRRYAHIAEDPEALYWVAKGQAAAMPVKPKQQQQPKRVGGAKPNSMQPDNTKPVKAKTPGEAIKQALEQHQDLRKRLRDNDY